MFMRHGFGAFVVRVENAIRDALNYRERIRSLEQALADREKELEKAHGKLDAIEARRNRRDAFGCPRCNARPGINCNPGCYEAEARSGGPVYSTRKLGEIDEIVSEYLKGKGVPVPSQRYYGNTVSDLVKKALKVAEGSL